MLAIDWLAVVVIILEVRRGHDVGLSSRQICARSDAK
jgi:hypothetical protein